MALTFNVEMPAALRGKRRKQRKDQDRWTWYVVNAPVSIEETDAISDPEGLVLTYDRWAKTGPRRKETVRMCTAGHDGALWRRLKAPDGGPARFDALLAPQRDGHWNDFPFVKWGRQRDAADMPSYEGAAVMMREITLDTGDAARLKAQKIAEGVIAAGGVLWRKDMEPVWLVRETYDKIEIDYNKPFPTSVTPGIPFRIDQRDEAERVAGLMSKDTGKKVKTSGMQVENPGTRYLSRTTPDTLNSMLSAACRSTHRILKSQSYGNWRDRGGSVPQTAFDAEAAFKEHMREGGSLLAAAERLDFMISFDPHCPDDPNASPRWRSVVEGAIRYGCVIDTIGGVEPELENEDEAALYGFGT